MSLFNLLRFFVIILSSYKKIPLEGAEVAEIARYLLAKIDKIGYLSDRAF